MLRAEHPVGGYLETKLSSRDRGRVVVIDRLPGERLSPAEKATELQRQVAPKTPDYRLLSFRPTRVGGHRAFEWIFEQGSLPQRRVDYLLRVGGDGYAVLGAGGEPRDLGRVVSGLDSGVAAAEIRVRLTITDPGASPAVKLQAVVKADQSGSPFLVYAAPEAEQRVAILEPEDTRLWLGRDPSCDIVLDWDEQVSRTHAELSRVGSGWAVMDDGLSRNGTFVGAERVGGRRRLHDRDVLRLGATQVVFRDPSGAPGPRTAPGESPIAVDLTPMQHKVLVALCRPLLEGQARDLPATNREIAEELVLSIDGVKTHLRALFAKLEVEDLPQNRKRVSLAERALAGRLATVRDLKSTGV